MSTVANIAIIGAGRIANTHARGYGLAADKGRIHTVVDIDPELARQKAELWGATRWTTDVAEAIADSEVDAVDVCLPHDLHHRVACAALRAGKPVLIEKPLATTLAEADEMTAEAAAAGTFLMVAHNHLFNPIIEHAAQVIARGAIGDVYLAKARWIGWFTLSATDFRRSRQQMGGGVFADAGAHPLYLVDALCGHVAEVSGMGTRRSGSMEAEDTAIVTLLLEGGGLAEISASITATLPGKGRGSPAGWQQGIEIFGSKGSIRASVAEETIWIYSESDDVMDLYRGETRIQMPNSRNAAFDREIAHFLDCVAGREVPRITPDDGRRILETILAANEAMETGSRVRLGAKRTSSREVGSVVGGAP
jgi:predicted dehydrogenase